jgi:MoaA/NifB/PqqE/SkfB family radical SAM enzyme
LPLNVITQIIDQSCAWGSHEIVISGDGEPTMHPCFRNIVDYICSKNLSIFLTTNATFPPKLLPAVARIDRLYINFSAPNQALYTRVQSPKSPEMFNTVLRNIKALGTLSRRHNKPLLTCAYIINKTNYSHIPEAIALFEDLEVHEVIFRMMESTSDTRALLLSTSEKKKLLRLAKPLCQRKFKFTHNLRGIYDELSGKNTSPYRLKHCFTGWYNVFVDFNQNVGICCHNENLIMGNLKKASLKEIWESRRAQKLRLTCKYDFDIKRAPFKGECEWCHWYRENQTIEKELKTLLQPCS